MATSKFTHFFPLTLGGEIGLFGDPTKVDTEGANRMRVNQKPLWDKFLYLPKDHGQRNIPKWVTKKICQNTRL